MSRKNASRKPSRRQQSFTFCLRDFLTPSLFRQLYRLVPKRRNQRWALQPLLFTMLCMTWCVGDSQPERFETARAFYVAVHPKRRRPGKSFQGYQKALEALPCSLLRAVAHLLRKNLLLHSVSRSSPMAGSFWAVMAPACAPRLRRIGTAFGRLRRG